MTQYVGTFTVFAHKMLDNLRVFTTLNQFIKNVVFQKEIIYRTLLSHQCGGSVSF